MHTGMNTGVMLLQTGNVSCTYRYAKVHTPVWEATHNGMQEIVHTGVRHNGNSTLTLS